MNKQRQNIIITIDGPAASGKGSLARKLAEHLGYDFLDTGALYRLVALKSIERNLKPDQTDSIIQISYDLSQKTHENYNDSDLRTNEIGEMASIIAQIPEVRHNLDNLQRNFAKNSIKGAVLDGRDIGTVICPDADVKLFITASTEKRAERRTLELQSRGINAKQSTVLAEMQERDERDSVRLNEHMKPGNNAIMIDTSDMTPSEVFDTAINIIKSQTLI